MSIERRMDDLIAAGWRALSPDSGPTVVQYWKQRALDYMTAVHGSDHVYTRHFANWVRQSEKEGRDK